MSKHSSPEDVPLACVRGASADSHGTSRASPVTIARPPAGRRSDNDDSHCSDIEPLNKQSSKLKPKQGALKPDSATVFETSRNSSESESDDEVLICVDRLRKPNPKPEGTKPGNIWLAITKSEVDAKGRRIESHPFLSTSNLKDKVIIRHCLVDQPFTAEPEKVVQAWSDVAQGINNEADMDGTLLFWPDLSGTDVKERFEGYMKYASASTSMNEVPSRFCCDDEFTYNEIQQGVDDLYYQYTRWLEAKGTVKQQSLASLKKGTEAAGFFRCKAMGLGGKGRSRKQKRSRTSSTGMNPGRCTESLDTLADQFRIRQETKREHKKAVRALHAEKRKLQKLQLQYDKKYKMLQMEYDLEKERNEAAEEKAKLAGEAEGMENERTARETAQVEAFKRNQETIMKLCMTIMMRRKGTDDENTK